MSFELLYQDTKLTQRLVRVLSVSSRRTVYEIVAIEIAQ